ncbi:hypothetical protein HHL19_16185 [Streptomyces sp. R302]|uniref:hypothetical protein n=1 Tax=unclassified Streptomyces TaxID=2593676 RepID=UPI00145FC101|nr:MULTISPECIES: hypothetical protein [unclassified Streptomyces]NML55312.1 hypothetical protein [Streptomyces sp. R301]NML80184.1 hypothetical protein [Streptomyces sp. R302]
MSSATGHTVPVPARRELAALATVTRPDWNPPDIHEALVAAHISQVTWGQVLTEMGRLMADPEARPSDLATTGPDAWRRRRPPPPPETAHRGAAAARAALHTDHDTTPDATH